jgi:hypothetical protein
MSKNGRNSSKAAGIVEKGTKEEAAMERKLSNLSPLAKETDSKRIVAVQVYRSKYSAGMGLTGGSSTVNSGSGGSRRKNKRSLQIRLYDLAFLALYVYQVGWTVSTVGDPYREFLEKAEREGFRVMEGTTRYRAELEHAVRDVNDADRRTKKIGWFDWMDMDIEELAAEKKRDKMRTVLDSLPKSMRVPGRYQAAFWPSLLLGMLATLHALVVLMQHWSVAFNVALNYRELDASLALESVSDSNLFELDLHDDGDAEDDDKDGTSGDIGNVGGGGGMSGKFKTNERGERIVFPDREITGHLPTTLPTHARVVPAKGSHVLVAIEYLPVLGMTFEYHRRRYHYDDEAEQWTKIRCRTDFPLEFLREWVGFPAPHQTVAGQIRFGPNMFKVKQPTFGELYKKQLLNPFSVFQIFCVLLWAIDDYIVYSFFSLFMVLMFEGTVVFQRIKSLQALTGMGNPSRNVYVYRSGHWSTIDSAASHQRQRRNQAQGIDH